MKSHIRACLILLCLTVGLCCIVYPLILFAVGGAIFPSAATGSMVVEKVNGKAVIRGSHMIGQPFTAKEYFWPRPSATAVTAYNATASGASNYGSSNPKLRDRVTQQLGPLVVYKANSGSAGPNRESPHTPQEDIEKWFAAKPDRVAAWAAEFSTAAANWAKTDFADDKYGLPGQFIEAWSKDHPEVQAGWTKDNPKSTETPKPEDLVAYFFESYAKAHPGKWAGIVENEQANKTKLKQIKPVASDAEIAEGTPGIAANFFEMWLRDPANQEKAADLELVIADMVMASGSGLDPDITLRNALSVYQLDRVARERTPKGGDVKAIRDAIAKLVKDMSYTPLSGLVGEPLVNVFDLNRALDAKYPVPVKP